MSKESELKTAAPDPRFPNCNVARWCFATFVDHQKCSRLLGEGSECCQQFEKIYKSICPNEWVSKWNEQIEIGSFPAHLPPAKDYCKK